MAVQRKPAAVPSTEAEKIKSMIVLMKESIEIRRGELAETKQEILRLNRKAKEIEKSMKRFEKLVKAAQS
ncbi:MAG: hypothetical protein WA708_16255 [Acidobacteriaceae bacterium]